MKKLILLLVFLYSTGLYAQQVYDARIGEKEILTPEFAKVPQINGPTVYGVRPGKKIVYRIPCTGQRPMQFKVKGLPKGITLDAVNGIISGISPSVKGEYPMTLTAKNSDGKVSRNFKLIVGDKIALTPPTGWNSWGGHMLLISDSLIRKVADVFVKRGFADVGFQYISMDDCWMKISPENYAARSEGKKQQHEGFNYDGLIGDVRDQNGNIIPNSHFPDMKAMTDYIHSFGLKAGLYSSPGPFTCQNFAGSLGHEKPDADQYARWGFDLLKYDLCSGGKCLSCLRESDTKFPQSEFWRPMATYLLQQDRDILFNLCQYGQEEPWKWAPSMSISSWRSSGDLNHKVENYFANAMRIATELREYSKPGQWNDPDFMYIHKIVDYRKMMQPTREIPLNTNQRYQYVTLWSVVCAPYFFSCNLNEIDDFTVRLLTNAGLMNINQDELGHVAEVLRNSDNEVIMVKKLADGSKVIALFNTNAETEKIIELKSQEFGFKSNAVVYDVWRQKSAGNFGNNMKVKLSANGVALFHLKF